MRNLIVFLTLNTTLKLLKQADLLNLWAHCFPKPVFSHTEIFEQYHSEFQKDPTAFFKHFFAQVKSCELSHEQKI